MEEAWRGRGKEKRRERETEREREGSKRAAGEEGCLGLP